MQLDLPVLEAGDAATISAPDGIEAAVVLLAGDVDARRPARALVPTCSTEPATAVYLPPGTLDRGRGERAHRARARGDRRRRAARADRRDARRWSRRPTSSCTTAAGPAGSAQVHDIVADAVPAQRLLVGETFNAAGQWSSFPPHKHDGGDGEPALEEVYYYRFDRPDGFGFQGLYEHDGSASERAVFLRHGAVVGIPRGYHPVCAAPGYRLYYLWALGPAAGHRRALALARRPRAPLAARPPEREDARGPTARSDGALSQQLIRESSLLDR